MGDLIALNKLQDCKIYPFALGEAPAVVELLQRGVADQAASVVEGFRPEGHYSSRQFATVFPGDDVLGGAEPAEISVIKIDVEGAERDVLIGLTRTVDRHRPFIICEVLPVYDEVSAIGRFRLARQREIEAFLRERRYSIHRVGPDGALTKLEEFGVHGDLSACNYVFSPAERGV
jgi:FkbM family methyltransferase